MSTPMDRQLDELRAAYFDVPAGQPSTDQVAGAMPRLVEAVGAVLRESGRLCVTCGEDHSRAAAGDVEHDDFAAILRALSLGDHARPISRHAIVHEEILPAIRRLVGDQGQTAATCGCPGVQAGYMAHMPDCPAREARPFA